jgi:hypothetical protein
MEILLRPLFPIIHHAILGTTTTDTQQPHPNLSTNQPPETIPTNSDDKHGSHTYTSKMAHKKKCEGDDNILQQNDLQTNAIRPASVCAERGILRARVHAI